MAELRAISTFEGDRSIAGLSGGEQQRIGLARAIVTDPKILLLDEPLSSLDAHLRIRMQSELRALHKKLGMTFVFVTHDQSEALAMADRIVVMESGQIQQVGTPQEVYREPANRFVADFVGTNNILSGRAEDVSTESARIVTSVGEFAVAAPGRHVQRQERVSFLIRADRVYVNTSPGRYDNEITGTLVGEKYIGSRVILVIELPDGSEFLIEQAEDDMTGRRPKLGGEVTAGWKRDDTYLLPEETGGRDERTV
jgi:spermidine/putrescine transport system ATP-binding protein